jgi:hypothetical protein
MLTGYFQPRLNQKRKRGQIYLLSGKSDFQPRPRTCRGKKPPQQVKSGAVELKYSEGMSDGWCKDQGPHYMSIIESDPFGLNGCLRGKTKLEEAEKVILCTNESSQS